MIRFMSLIEIILTQYTGLVALSSLGFFYLPTIIIDPSIKSVGLFLVGALIGIVFRVMLTYLEDIRMQRELLRGYLNLFSRCIFHEYQISDYAEEGSQIQLESMTLPFHIKGRTFRLNIKRITKLYVVKRGRSHVVPSQLTSYLSLSSGPLIPSYIFVRDEPEKITSLGKFFVYHEVGHTSARNMDARVTTLLWWKMFLLPVPWAIISLQPNLISLVVIALYVALFAIAMLIYKYIVKYALLQEEIMADRFARRCLSYESLEVLAKYLRTGGQIPKDSKINDFISEHLNTERSKLLLDDIDKSGNLSKANNSLEIEYQYPATIMYIYSFFALFILAMGSLNRTPSTTLLCINGAILLITLGVFAWVSEKRSRLKEEIESYLSETNKQKNEQEISTGKNE